MSESIFGQAAAMRQKEQKDREAKLKNMPTAQDDDEIIRVNISLSRAYHEKMKAYAKKKCIPVSMLIRNWIDEHCD